MIAHARQPGRAVGVDARDHQDRRGHPADDDGAADRRPRPTASSADRCPARDRRRRPTPTSSTSCPGDYTRHLASERRRRGLAALRRRVRRSTAPDAAPRHGRRRPAAALLHLGHDQPTPSSSSTPTCPTRSVTSRRCTGWACGRATCTSNISSPGWAKHAWSCFFAPWIAEATSLRLQLRALRRRRLLPSHAHASVTTFCAPPTVWRMLIQADLAAAPAVACASSSRRGEPLNPEVIAQVRGCLGAHHPRRLRPDRDDRADRQLPRAADQGRLDGPPAARLPDRARRPRHRRARSGRGRDLPRPLVAHPIEPDDRVRRRRRAQTPR